MERSNSFEYSVRNFFSFTNGAYPLALKSKWNSDDQFRNKHFAVGCAYYSSSLSLKSVVLWSSFLSSSYWQKRVKRVELCTKGSKLRRANIWISFEEIEIGNWRWRCRKIRNWIVVQMQHWIRWILLQSTVETRPTSFFLLHSSSLFFISSTLTFSCCDSQFDAIRSIGRERE